MNLKNNWKMLLIVFVGLAIVVTAGWALTAKDNNVPAQAEEEQVTSVKAEKVVKGDVATTIKISGKVAASKEVSVVSKIGGKVTQLKVQVGQRVKQGDLLVLLDGIDIQAQINLHEASVALTQAGQQQAEIAYQEAEINLERMQVLYDQGAISKKQLEDAENAYARAAASYNPDSGSTQTAAQLRQAQAQLDAAKINLANTRITAPIDGIVASVNIESGEMANPSAPLLTIVDTDQMIVEGNLAESEVNFAKIGEKVKVYVSSASDESFVGVMENVSPIASSTTKAYPIRVRIENNNQLLKGGMTAEVDMTAEAKEEVIVLPKEAVLDKGEKFVVFVVENNIAQERIVNIGLTTDAKAEILKGLEVGEQVVVSGQQYLSEGVKVKLETGGQ